MLRKLVVSAKTNAYPFVSWRRTATTDAKAKDNSTDVDETAKEFELRLKELQVLKASPLIVELPDSEYPSWLWTVNQPELTLTQMQELGLEKLSIKQRERFFKLQRRSRVKQKNIALSR